MTFKIGDKVRQNLYALPYLTRQGLIGKVVRIEDYIIVSYDKEESCCPYFEDELELVEDQKEFDFG